MSTCAQQRRPGVRDVFCGLAGWLTAACWAFPLNLDNTVMQTKVREREAGLLHLIVYEAHGPTLDERHLVRNDTGKPDARVHATLTDAGDGTYLLQLQSQDLGTADHYRAHIQVELPKESCYSGYWYLTDLTVLQDDLVTGARPIVYNAGDRSIDVSYHRAQRGPMRFTQGQMRLSFRVDQMCF